jgi:hypothetical protein
MPPNDHAGADLTQPQMTQSLMTPAPNAGMLVGDAPLGNRPGSGDARKVSRATLGPGSTVTAADGTTLFVKDWRGDARDDRPVVFLASLGAPSDMWDYQIFGGHHRTPSVEIMHRKTQHP